MAYNPSANPMSRLIYARTLRNDSVPNIPPTEISKKVNYILNLDIENPLELNLHDMPVVFEALRNRLIGTTMFDDISTMRRIDELGINTENIKRYRATLQTPGIQGGRRKTRRRSRKYKKYKK